MPSRFRAEATLFAPDPSEIALVQLKDCMSLRIANGLNINLADKIIDGDLEQEAKAMRKLASEASAAAAELERRAHTIPAPEEANGGTQLDNSTEDDPTDADQQAADALPFSYLACGDSLAYAAPIEPGTKAECPLHGETAVVAAPVTAPQRAVQA